MEFSPTQDRAMLKVKRWLDDPSGPQVFHFFGFAGTGKTTLAKHLSEGVDGKVIFAAFTGKAAHVLRQKGCDGASTIHSLIYHSREKNKEALKQIEASLIQTKQELRAEGATDAVIKDHPDVKKLEELLKKEEENSDQPFFVLNHDSEVKDAKLVVIDECSMVDDRMGSDLLSFGTKILVLGDPAQLPPVGGAGYFTENVTPDVMLEEIHRQAGESPIIRMATEVRNQRPLKIGDWGDGCYVYETGTILEPERMMSFDQIIVGKNKTRAASNRKMRVLHGFHGEYPNIDDKIVCLKNNHELGLLNGAIFFVSRIEGIMDRKVHMSIRPEDSMISIDVASHEHYFLGVEEELKWFEKGEAQSFDYGYALTCHKSQGSQWKDVCVFDQSYCFRDKKHRWLYTAITRASDTVTVVRM